MKTKLVHTDMSNFSKKSIILVLSAVIFIISYDGRFLNGKYNSMNWDAYSYYLYLPATFIHNTPFRFDFHTSDFEKYPVSSSVYQFYTVGEKQAPFFTMGVAICEMPFFLVAHGINKVFLNYPPDGMSLPYQLAILAAALSFLGLGLYFLRLILLPYLGEIATGITLLAVSLGTNLLYYTIYDAGLSHVYLFGLYAFLLYKTQKWHQNPRKATAFYIGATLALMCLVRPSELIAVLIPLFYGIYNLASFKQKWILIKENWQHIGIVVLSGLLVVLPQLVYWKIATGHFVVNSYAERGDFFDFTKPHLLEGLFSYRKGLLVYTPVMAFALLGFRALWKNQRAWFWPVLSFFCVNFYMLMCYHMWHFASCYGNRALIQSYAALALPLGYGIFAIYKKQKSLLIALVSFCILLNLFQTWQYVKGILPFDNINKAFYWRVFAATEKDISLRKYLQLKDFLPNIANYKPIPLHKMEQTPQATTSENPFSKEAAYTLDAATCQTLAKQWITFTADVFFSGDQASEDNSAKAVLSLTRDGKDIQWTGVNIQRCYPHLQWNKVEYEIQLPDSLRADDVLKAYIFSHSPDSIWVRSIGINRLIL
jgi:hypothetical protein